MTENFEEAFVPYFLQQNERNYEVRNFEDKKLTLIQSSVNNFQYIDNCLIYSHTFINLYLPRR